MPWNRTDRSCRALCGGVLAVAILAAAPAVRAKELPDRIVISTGEYRPFNSPALPGKGIVPRIVTEAFARVGIQVSWLFLPWNRAYELASRGQVDATAQWGDSEARAALHYYSDPLYQTVTGFFHLKTTPVPDWQDLSELKGLRIGAVRGYTYSKEFYDLINAGVLWVEFVDEPVLNYRKLMAGRLDMVVEELEVGYDMVRMNFPPEEAARVTHAPRPLTVHPVYLLFPRVNPKSVALRDAFNRGLAYIKAAGRFRQIFEEAGFADTLIPDR